MHEDWFEFDRSVCAAELRVGDQVVPALPVFYSAQGDWRTKNLSIVDVDVAVAGNARGLDPFLDADPEAAALVIVIDGADDLVVQCNRVPQMPATPGRPAVIIPGNWAERVDGAETELAFTATTAPGRSANVIASLGAADAPAINVTTPLTGWTPAGGERGTGLAVALAMAADLAANQHVTFSACSGHELDHIGLKHYLDSRNVAGYPVVHLGASIAAVEPESTGPAELGDRRMVLTTASGELRDEIGPGTRSKLAPARDRHLAGRRRHLVRSWCIGAVLPGRIIAVPHHRRHSGCDDTAGHGPGRRGRDRRRLALPRQPPMSGADNPCPR